MAIYSSTNTKEILLRKGDTGNIYFEGLPKDKAYSVYMSIYNPENNKIINEFQATTYTQASGEAYFGVNEETSNSFPVGEWEYFLKICANGSEDTILPRIYTNEDGEIIVENAPKFTVLEKGVEGD